MTSSFFLTLLADSSSEDIKNFLIFLAIIAAFVLFPFILTIILRSRATRKAMWYKSPFPESGCTGPMTDLSPVEAGIVLSIDISRLLTLYILDLVTYEDIKLLDLTPLTVKVLAQGEIPGFRKRFLDAVEEDGSLDPEKMLLALDFLYKDLEKRIRNFGVKTTVGYYLDKVDTFWDRIQEERATSKRLKTLEQNFPWLLLHEDAADNLERMFMTSPRWPTVRPIVKTLRMIRNHIVKNEELLEHAAHHPEGIFSNKSYREGITAWAREHIRRASSLEMRRPQMVLPYATYEVDSEKEEARENRHEDLTRKLDKLQHMLEMVENADES